MLAKAELVHGKWYIGTSRITNIAVWSSRIDEFCTIRFKFGVPMVEMLPHPDDAEEHLDRFVPEKEVLTND